MTTPDLHALWATRSLGKLRSFLKSTNSGASRHGGGASSLSRSPNFGVGGMGSAVIAAELNRKDFLGRTVLHLAVTVLEEWALGWVEVLIAERGLQVNLGDGESGWGALHRALYAGNIAAARMLLGREDVDARLKDHEGLTPFDLYNSTVLGTNPLDSALNPSSTDPTLEARIELFTWGANRNYVLGFSGDGDRVFPEKVRLDRMEGSSGLEKWEPLRIRGVGMARLHTGIVTDEERNNIRLCGYGTGGRLGVNSHTQFLFSPLASFPHSVASVVLSPDHTVLITTSGHVYTFGLNRHEQLGYTLDDVAGAAISGQNDEPVQSVPKRVVGALKKEVVLGAAASRTHTAVYTAESVFTWGTNRGQLGYGTPAGEVAQILPRRVTTVQAAVIQLSATENATACLLESKDVLVLYHEGYLRVAFPGNRFPREMQSYRPPQVSSSSNIDKIVSSGNTFVALSSLGDVFSFVLDSSTTRSDPPSSLARMIVKPQRIWSLRRQFTGVTDVAVGQDGTIILSTRSGHVFVRTKRFESNVSTSKGTATPPSASAQSKGSAGGGWKFSRVPYLQRVIKVGANSTGAFAAIRADVPLRPIPIEGPTLAEDLLSILPHWRRIGPAPEGPRAGRRPKKEDDDDDEDEEDKIWVEQRVEVALRMFDVLREWDSSWQRHSFGTDALVVVKVPKILKDEEQTFIRIPVHSRFLALRSAILRSQIAASDSEELHWSCTPLTALLLLHYIYSDDLIPIWDSQIGMRIREARLGSGLGVLERVNFVKVREELGSLAGQFGLDKLVAAVGHHVRTAPTPSLVSEVGGLLRSSGASNVEEDEGDIVLVLAKGVEVRCHSLVLRARCSVFETFYHDIDWTILRGGDQQDQVLRFDLSHVEERVMEVVLRFIYADGGIEMFDVVDYPTADEYIDFVILVLAAANELLIDKLKAICSGVLRKFITLHNVCSILVDAAFYEANDLANACMHFIACSMETVLEGRLLDDLPPDLIAAVSAFCQGRQGARLPISRSGILVTDLMSKHAEWAADLDLPKATGGAKKFKSIVPRSPGPSPSLLSPNSSPQLRPHRSPNLSPALHPTREVNGSDEPFTMDDDFSLDSSPTRASFSASNVSSTNAARRSSTTGQVSGSPSMPSYMSLGSPPPPRLQPWTSLTTSRPSIDLRGIMATEAASRPKSASPAVDRSDAVPPRNLTPTKTTATVSPVVGWRVPTPTANWRAAEGAPRPSLANIQSEQGQKSPAIPSSRPEPARAVTQRPQSSSATPTAGPSNSSSAVGAPVIVPQRLANRIASASRPPKGSFGAADVPWTNYTSSSPTVDPISSSPPSSSFASIQSEQRAVAHAYKETKAPRSFAEVMAQEAEDAAKLSEEIEFARWWAEESERVRLEAEKASASKPNFTPTKRGGGGPKGSVGKKGGKAKATQVQVVAASAVPSPSLSLSPAAPSFNPSASSFVPSSPSPQTSTPSPRSSRPKPRGSHGGRGRGRGTSHEGTSTPPVAAS